MKFFINSSLSFIFLLISYANFGQANQWAVVVHENKSNIIQNAEISSNKINEQFINNYTAKNNLYIQDYVFSNLGLTAIFSNKYKMQRFYASKTFPTELIKQGWSENLRINKLIYVKGVYMLVMNDLGDDKQSVSFVKSAEDLKKTIDSFYTTHNFNTICRADDRYIIVKSKRNQQVSSIYNISSTIPHQWIKEQQTKGYYIQNLHYVGGRWLVLMNYNPSHPKQEVHTGNSLTSSYMDALKKRNYVIEHCVYSLDIKKMEQEYDNLVAEGNKLMDDERYEDAIEYFNSAINTFKYSPEAYFGRMESRYWASQYYGCLYDANFILNNFDKNNVEALDYMAEMGYFIDDYPTALTGLTKLLSKADISNNDKGKYYEYRGDALKLLGFYNKAIADYKQAISFGRQQFATGKLNKVIQDFKNYRPLVINLVSSYEQTIVRNAQNTFKFAINSENKNLKSVVVTINENPVTVNKANYTIASIPVTLGITFTATLTQGLNVIEIATTDEFGKTYYEEFLYKYIPQNQITYHALLIANNKYDHPTSFSNLQNPIADATKLHGVLINKYKFDEHNVSLLENATKDDILKKLREYKANLGKNDHLLIFYAGHGYMDSVKGPNKSFLRGYWIPVDAEPNIKTKEEWLNTSEISSYINSMKASKVLVVADACFSGSLIDPKKNITNAILNNGTCTIGDRTPAYKIMTSGNLTEVSDESIFFKNLINVLSTNTSSCISSSAIFPRIKHSGAQNAVEPQYGVFSGSNDEDGDFIFIKR